MSYDRPSDLLAGFIAARPDASVPELVMAGEQWAPPEKRIAEHSHEVWEFYLQVEGKSVWRAGRQRLELGPGGLLVAPPGVRHALPERQPGAHHYLFAAVDLERVARRLGVGPMAVFKPGEMLFRAAAGEIRPAFQSLVREVSLVRPWRSVALRIAVDTLALEVSRVLGGEPTRPLGRHPAVHRAALLIEQEPERAWRTPALAQRAGVSAPHLVTLFRRDLGTTPRAFLLATRMQRATELLRRGDWTITRLALELGFSSSQHFAAAFKRHHAMTPSEFVASGRARKSRWSAQPNEVTWSPLPRKKRSLKPNSSARLATSI